MGFAGTRKIEIRAFFASNSTSRTVLNKAFVSLFLGVKKH